MPRKRTLNFILTLQTVRKQLKSTFWTGILSNLAPKMRFCTRLAKARIQSSDQISKLEGTPEIRKRDLRHKSIVLKFFGKLFKKCSNKSRALRSRFQQKLIDFEFNLRFPPSFLPAAGDFFSLLLFCEEKQAKFAEKRYPKKPDEGKFFLRQVFHGPPSSL